MAGEENDGDHIILSYRGRTQQLPLAGAATLGDLAELAAQRFEGGSAARWAPQSVKLVPKGGAGVIKPLEEPQMTLASAGEGQGWRGAPRGAR